jgi:hypothetical protein
VALTTKVIERDLLMLWIMFPDGVKVTVTVRRNGKSVSVAPDSSDAAERLSSIFYWSANRVGEPGYPFTSLSQVIYGMETLARSATDVEQFIQGLREVLEASGKEPSPKAEVPPASSTLVDLRPSGNGWIVDAQFQNGEKFKLAINKASVGWASDPPEPARDNDVMGLLSRSRSTRGLTDEELALITMEVASYSSDIAGWLQALCSTISVKQRP